MRLKKPWVFEIVIGANPRFVSKKFDGKREKISFKSEKKFPEKLTAFVEIMPA